MSVPRSLSHFLRSRLLLVSLLIGLALAAWAGWACLGSQAQARATLRDLAALRAQAEALDLNRGERVWDEIPWVRSLDQAKTLSRQTGRPIFLFSMWGDLDGRC